MNKGEWNEMGDARRLMRELHELGDVHAPPALLSGVLARLGLGDAYWQLDTPIGPVFVAYNDAGISALRQAGDAEGFEAWFRSNFGRPARPIIEPPASLHSAVTGRLQGNSQPGLSFDLRGLSEFERAVLLKALEIPRGEVRPYGWIAREIGRPQATRAVGAALGGNPVPLLIPCHRVVHSDGHIGNYVFGSQAKRAVLDAEGAAPDVLEALARSGVRFLGDDRDGTYCLPSCGRMHLRTGYEYHRFRSESEAVAAGLLPCDTCRPALAS